MEPRVPTTTLLMRAIVYTNYGPPEVLQVKEVPTPQPKDNEVRIKIRSVAINQGDCELRVLKPINFIWLILRIFMGPFRPRKKILGAYLSGEIEAIGVNVTQFKVGDEVFGVSDMRFGAYAEYLCLPENGAIGIKPENISFDEACTIPIGFDPYHFLGQADIQTGDKVLINGAGGGMGSLAVQIAHDRGGHVTAVDRGEKKDILRSLGADKFVDYRNEDFADGGEQYDVIFDLIGRDAFSRSLKALKPGGIYLQANPDGILPLLRAAMVNRKGHKRVFSKFADGNKEDLAKLGSLCSQGRLKGYIDRTYTMDQIVEAHHYVESGLKQGHVVLRVS